MSKSICVIDDDPIYQIIVKKIIARAGVFENITSYDCCAEALDQMKDPTVLLPDLILLDINMPVMDGWQFLQQLLTYRPQLAGETCIYIVTSSIAHSDRLTAKSFVEVTGFISKPLTVARLLEIEENL